MYFGGHHIIYIQIMGVKSLLFLLFSWLEYFFSKISSWYILAEDLQYIFIFLILLQPALVNTHALTAVVKAKHLRVLEWGIVIRELSDSSLNRGFDSYDSLQCTKTISLLRPGFSLDPNVKHDSRAIETVTVTEFTERLCASLPDCPTIKVFNTHVVGRLSPHSTLWCNW